MLTLEGKMSKGLVVDGLIHKPWVIGSPDSKDKNYASCMVMDAIAGNGEMAGQLLDKFMADEGMRSMVMEKVLANGDMMKGLMSKMSSDQTMVDGILNMAVQDETMKAHVMGVLQGMKMSGGSK